MPALQANCASCHNPGQVGAAHWTLATADDAVKISDGIGSVVDAGYMPPWPASPHGVALLNSKRLDQPTIDAIVQWSRAGGPLDVPATTKIEPKGGPPVPKPAQGRRAADARGVRRFAERRERLPLLRPRSEDHEADVPHRLLGHARPARRDPPRAAVPRRRVAGRRRAQAVRGATASRAGVVTAPSTCRRRSATTRYGTRCPASPVRPASSRVGCPARTR